MKSLIVTPGQAPVGKTLVVRPAPVGKTLIVNPWV